MIYIKKGDTPPNTRKRVNEIEHSRTPESRMWQALPEESNGNDRSYTAELRAMFDTLPKEEIRTALWKEQHGLCAYCMRRIKNDSTSKIEHWYPLSRRKQTAIQYSNFLLCCSGKNAQGEKVLECCDESKGNQTIEINPLNEAMMAQITYRRDGTIVLSEEFPKEQTERFQKDFDAVLRLNGESSVLRINRQSVYAGCQANMKKLEKQGKLKKSTIEKIISELTAKSQYPEYVGVELFYYQRWLKRHNA